jgi:hypothetical protein
MVTLVRSEQLENASLYILVTEFGISILVRPEQPENAYSPMVVTEFGMMVFLHPAINLLEAVSIMALQLFRESYMLLPDLTVMLVKPEQPENA